METQIYNPFVIQLIKDNTVNNKFSLKDEKAISIIKDFNNLGKLIKCKPGSLVLFIYIAGKLQIKKKSVHLPLLKTQQALGLSRKTIYSSIAELIEIEVIARQAFKDMYWINPRFIQIEHVHGHESWSDSEVLTPESVIEYDHIVRGYDDRYCEGDSWTNFLSDDAFYWD